MISLKYSKWVRYSELLVVLYLPVVSWGEGWVMIMRDGRLQYNRPTVACLSHFTATQDEISTTTESAIRRKPNWFASFPPQHRWPWQLNIRLIFSGLSTLFWTTRSNRRTLHRTVRTCSLLELADKITLSQNF